MNRSDTIAACKSALDRYAAIWADDHEGDPSSWSHLWQKSNEMDSYLLFAERCTLNFPEDNTNWFSLVPVRDSPILMDLRKYIENATGPPRRPDLWTDDYGWAGIAAISVARWMQKWHEDWLDGSNPNQYAWVRWANLAIACWTCQYNVAQNSVSQGGTPISKGVTNQPPSGGRGVYFKNTVTGANYFALSIKLFQFLQQSPSNANGMPPIAPQQKLCLQAAYDQYIWFKSWIETKAQANIPYNYYHTVTAGTTTYAMLEDRPIAYAPYVGYEPSPDNNLNEPPWTPNSSWTGDQGLFLHACSLLYLWGGNIMSFLGKTPEDVAAMNRDLSKWLPEIATGIVQLLTCGDIDDVLREPPFANTYIGDPGDYMCGRGVLARYLMREETISAYKVIKPQYDLVAAFASCWSATAKVVADTGKNNTVTPGQLSAVWNPGNDSAFCTNFIRLWGSGENLSWSEPPFPGPVWNNYCMMMGFDLYSSWIRVNTGGIPLVIQTKEQAQAAGGACCRYH